MRLFVLGELAALAEAQAAVGAAEGPLTSVNRNMFSIILFGRKLSLANGAGEVFQFEVHTVHMSLAIDRRAVDLVAGCIGTRVYFLLHFYSRPLGIFKSSNSSVRFIGEISTFHAYGIASASLSVEKTAFPVFTQCEMGYSKCTIAKTLIELDEDGTRE